MHRLLQIRHLGRLKSVSAFSCVCQDGMNDAVTFVHSRCLMDKWAIEHTIYNTNKLIIYFASTVGTDVFTTAEFAV